MVLNGNLAKFETSDISKTGNDLPSIICGHVLLMVCMTSSKTVNNCFCICKQFGRKHKSYKTYTKNEL